MLINSDELADLAISQIKEQDLIVIDTETSGIDGIKDGRDYLTGVAVGFYWNNNWTSYYFPIRHANRNIPEQKVLALREVITDHAVQKSGIIFHNAKFDIHSLATLGKGWDFWYKYGNFYCTMTMAHMCNEELPSKELDWLSKKFLNDAKLDELKDFTKIFGWAKVPPHIMAPYAEHDVYLTGKLFSLFKRDMQEQNILKLWEDEQEFIRMLARCEKNGLTLVTETARELASEGNRILLDIERELQYRPSETSELQRVFFTELNMPILEYTCGCSVDESDEFCKKKANHANKASLNKHVMEQYDEMLQFSDNDLARKVLTYRGWQKATSSWYEAFPILCSPDGKVRTNFKPHGTRTGRLSSNTPNLQQLPRNSTKAWNGRVRECFKESEGYKVIKFDFKNLELRLAADYCQIEPLLQAFNNGGDPHQVTADRVGIPRNPDAKNLNFAMLYGAGNRKIAYMLNRTEDAGTKIRTDFLAAYPGFQTTSRLATTRARQNHFVRYFTGRRKHYNYYNRGEEHKSFNALIQGGGAEVVKLAALRCRDLESDDCRFVLTVHDELDFEIREDLVDKYIPEIKERMEVKPHDMFTVKFETEHSIWGAKD